MRGQHCPEIVGPVGYHVLADWRFDSTARDRATGEGMPEELLNEIEDNRVRMQRICAYVEWQHEELLALGELTPHAVDRLLSRRTR